MYKLLVRLMVIASLIELGVKVSDFEGCKSRQCLRMIQRKALEVVKVEWKTMRVFSDDIRSIR